MARHEATPKPDRHGIITGQIERIKDLYWMGHIGKDEYTTRRHALEVELAGAALTPIAPLNVLSKARILLNDLAQLWAEATPEERSDLCGTPFDQVRVRDKKIVSARLARPEYLQLVATSEARRLEPDDSVDMAPPERVGDSQSPARSARLVRVRLTLTRTGP